MQLHATSCNSMQLPATPCNYIFRFTLYLPHIFNPKYVITLPTKIAPVYYIVAASVQSAQYPFKEVFPISALKNDGTKELLDHAVNERADAWIYDTCSSSKDAREVEQHFIAQGTRGAPGGGDASTKSVYAYRIAPHTVE